MKHIEEIVGLATSARILQLLIKLSHQKCCIPYPLITLTERFVAKIDDVIRSKFFWL